MRGEKTITSASTRAIKEDELRSSLDTRSSSSDPDLSLCVAAAMVEKQAENVLIIDLEAISGAQARYFVLGSAQNERQMDAIAEQIQRQSFTKYKEQPWFVEGTSSDHWLLLDYIDVVAHIFLPDKRARYALEELWGDARIISYHLAKQHYSSTNNP